MFKVADMGSKYWVRCVRTNHPLRFQVYLIMMILLYSLLEATFFLKKKIIIFLLQKLLPRKNVFQKVRMNQSVWLFNKWIIRGPLCRAHSAKVHIFNHSWQWFIPIVCLTQQVVIPVVDGYFTWLYSWWELPRRGVLYLFRGSIEWWDKRHVQEYNSHWIYIIYISCPMYSSSDSTQSVTW